MQEGHVLGQSGTVFFSFLFLQGALFCNEDKYLHKRGLLLCVQSLRGPLNFVKKQINGLIYDEAKDTFCIPEMFNLKRLH